MIKTFFAAFIVIVSITLTICAVTFAVCLAAGLGFTGRESFITWLRDHGLLRKSAV